MSKSNFQIGTQQLTVQSKPIVSGKLHVVLGNNPGIEIPYEFDFSNIPDSQHELALAYIQQLMRF